MKSRLMVVEDQMTAGPGLARAALSLRFDSPNAIMSSNRFNAPQLTRGDHSDLQLISAWRAFTTRDIGSNLDRNRKFMTRVAV